MAAAANTTLTRAMSLLIVNMSTLPFDMQLIRQHYARADLKTSLIAKDCKQSTGQGIHGAGGPDGQPLVPAAQKP